MTRVVSYRVKLIENLRIKENTGALLAFEMVVKIQ